MVRTSCDGYRAGSSLCFPSKNNNALVQPLFHKYQSAQAVRATITPHIKARASTAIPSRSPVLMPTIHWYQSYARMFGNELAWYGTQLATLHSRACLSPRELTHVRFIKGVHHLGQHVGRCMGQVGQERVDSLDTQL